jgi:A/G-specific adenine glycosylase
MQEHGGVLPSSFTQLKQLPGIGEYTAAAVASIAFGADELTVDANIRRVAARVFDLADPLGTPELYAAVRSNLSEHLPSGKAGDFNQALMELGACVCLPRQPLCGSCPIKVYCIANRKGNVNERPVKRMKPAVPHYLVTAAVIWQDGQVLLAKRPSSGLLGGMWEFPGGKLLPGETHSEGLVREIQEELGVQITVGEAIGLFIHAYTHFKVTLYAFHCQLNGDQPQALEAQEIRWVAPTALEEFPMGKIDRMISRKIQQAQQ